MVKKKGAKKKGTRKKSKKKTTKKSSKKPSKKKDNSTINFISAIGILIGIVLIFSFLKMHVKMGPDEVIATVNGHPIYQSTLQNIADNLPEDMKAVATDELLLEQLIQELLILQKAKELGITASDEEIDQRTEEILGALGVDLGTVLTEQKMSKREFRKMMKNNILANKLFEQVAYQDIEITDEEALKYYNDNAEGFIVPEQAAVRHIMIKYDDASLRETKALAEAILQETKENNFVDFCELVNRHSVDDYSKPICGRYNVSKVMPVPKEFISASFALDVGEAGIARTDNAYHIIHRLGTVPEKVVRFDSAKTKIKEILITVEKREAQRKLLAKLRENAEIENFLLDDLIKGVDEMIAQQEELESEELSFCLADKARIYGAKWDTLTKTQMEALGKVHVDYIECSVPGSLTGQKEECQGVKAYPTWVINGQVHMGVQTISRLKALAEC